MKKFYVLMIILTMTATILTGCNKKQPIKTDPTANSWSEITVSCEDTIKNYLENSDKLWTWVRTIKVWDSITVDYIWRLDAKEVFDTSIESVAKACNKYTAARDYNQWLIFTVWAWQMIAWFDSAVQGMKIGQTKTIEILPENAYWIYHPEYVIFAPKDKFPNPEEYTVGMDVMTTAWNRFKIINITETGITLDWNHELAGKTLIFDITIKAIN